MNIDELTIGELKQIQSLGTLNKSDDSHWKIGENYFLRTVTHYFTGRLEKVTQSELVFSSVSWIADSGRYADALKIGNLSEVEPYPKNALVIVGRGALIDAHIWKHKLPLEQK